MYKKLLVKLFTSKIYSNNMYIKLYIYIYVSDGVRNVYDTLSETG